MNKVILMGRLTRDPEVRYSQSNSGDGQMAIARYTLAVDRRFNRNVLHSARVQSSQRSILSRVLRLPLQAEFRLVATRIRMVTRYTQQMLSLRSRSLQRAKLPVDRHQVVDISRQEDLSRAMQALRDS